MACAEHASVIGISGAWRLHHAQRGLAKARGCRVITESSRVLSFIRWTGHRLAHATGNGKLRTSTATVVGGARHVFPASRTALVAEAIHFFTVSRAVTAMV